MFTKHVYTCPDVIHMRKMARRNMKISIVLNALFLGGLFALGSYAERQDKKNRSNVEVHETKTN